MFMYYMLLFFPIYKLSIFILARGGNMLSGLRYLNKHCVVDFKIGLLLLCIFITCFARYNRFT